MGGDPGLVEKEVGGGKGQTDAEAADHAAYRTMERKFFWEKNSVIICASRTEEKEVVGVGQVERDESRVDEDRGGEEAAAPAGEGGQHWTQEGPHHDED